MQDVEWAWSEDLNYNKELFPVVPGVLQDPVTGDPVKFTKIDDHTLTLSFDNPNYTFIGGRQAGGRPRLYSHDLVLLRALPLLEEIPPEVRGPRRIQEAYDRGWT